MRKKSLSLILMLLAGISATQAYDFSAVAPSGQTLYYNINSSGTTVTVSYPYNYAWYGYTTPSGSLTIPSSVTNSGTTYTVTAISQQAFHNCTDITSVSIPNTVTTIGQHAFSGCTSITSATIGNSVTSIGGSAFEGCTSLSSVNLPNSVTSIDGYAFSGCTSLTSITIPRQVTAIGQYAFASSGLTTINFNATNCTNIGTYSNTYAFNNCIYVTTINIGSNVTNIPAYAFVGCSNITSITIPDSVVNIGNSAFYNCTALTTINFNATNCTSYGNAPFSGCSNVNTINIGSNVTRIPAYGFNGFTLVNSITIPSSVNYIGDYAFSGCTCLTTVNYNADSCITMNGSYIFNNCSNFSTLNIGSNVHYIPTNAFYNCRAITSVVIPDSVTTIGTSAFYGCQGITSVTIGKRVRSILNDAFANCTTLVITHYTGTLTQWCNIDFYNAASNPVANSGNLYINNQPIINMVIPDSVTIIRNYSFYGCTDLNSVVIPNTVTTIHQYPFYYCDHMTSITLGSALTSIGNSAFYGCSAVNSITSLATVAPSIGNSTFGYSGNSYYLLFHSNIYIPCGSHSSYTSRWYNSSSISYNELAGPSFAVYTADSTMGSVNVLVHPSCTTQTASFVAAPLLGYRFDHWSDGVTDNPRTLTVTQDTLLAAFFVLDAIPHDTVYVYLHDTITVGEPMDFYDLSVLSVQSTGIAVGSGQFCDGTIVEIAGIPVVGNHFVQWSDGNTENPRHVTVTSDITLTAMFDIDQVGVTEVPSSDFIVTVQDNVITVQGTTEQRVRIFDAVGRLLITVPNTQETQHFRMTSTGVYLVQVGDGTAQRVVVR